MTSPARRGRRPGGADTRAAVLTAARELFAARGFTATTIRAIAASAGVDAALVHHYFGTKADLFVAALELPVDPRVTIATAVVPGPREELGERLLSVMLRVWDDPANTAVFVALVRSGMEPEGERLLRDGFIPVAMGPAVAALGVDHPELRASVLASQTLGLLAMRYVLRVAPLDRLPAEEVVRIYAPTIQRYLTGPLGGLTTDSCSELFIV